MVTTLKRRSTELLAEVNREAYEFEQLRVSILEGIARGERAIAQDDTLTQTEVEQRMSKWLT